MSWKGDYWGPEGALKKAREKFLRSSRSPEEQIAYASVLYSAATRSVVEVKQALRRCDPRIVLWIWRFVVSGYQAVMEVDYAWYGQSTVSMAPEKVEISLAVWIRLGWLRGGRHLRAHEVACVVDVQLPFEYANVKPHTRAFLLSHLASVGVREIEPVLRELEQLVEEVEDRGEIEQASRIWRHIAQHRRTCYGETHESVRVARRCARKLAHRAGADDQLIKLNV